MLWGENREKASSRRESIPGHLWLELPLFCHWAMTAGQPPTLTILYMYCTGANRIVTAHTVTAHTEWLPGACASHSVLPVQYIESWWLLVVVWQSWLNGRHWLLHPEVSWVQLSVTADLFYFRLIISKFTIPFAKRMLMLVGTNIAFITIWKINTEIEDCSLFVFSEFNEHSSLTAIIGWPNVSFSICHSLQCQQHNFHHWFHTQWLQVLKLQ